MSSGDKGIVMANLDIAQNNDYIYYNDIALYVLCMYIINMLRPKIYTVHFNFKSKSFIIIYGHHNANCIVSNARIGSCQSGGPLFMQCNPQIVQIHALHSTYIQVSHYFLVLCSLMSKKG